MGNENAAPVTVGLLIRAGDTPEFCTKKNASFVLGEATVPKSYENGPLPVPPPLGLVLTERMPSAVGVPVRLYASGPVAALPTASVKPPDCCVCPVARYETSITHVAPEAIIPPEQYVA